MAPPLTWNVDRGSQSVLVTVDGTSDPASTLAFHTMLGNQVDRAPAALLVDLSVLPVGDPGLGQIVEKLKERTAAAGRTAVLVRSAATAINESAPRRTGRRAPFTCRLADTTTALITSGPGPESFQERLLPIAGAARHGRDMVTEACLRWNVAHLIGTATLVVTELISYAIDHAHTVVTLIARMDDGVLYVGVRHGPATRLSADSHVGPTASSSLCLIHAVVTHWGFIPDGNDTISAAVVTS